MSTEHLTTQTLMRMNWKTSKSYLYLLYCNRFELFSNLEEESPYPEVRSAVANTDDVFLPCSTLRVWIIGLNLAILLSGINQILFFRYPAPWLDSIVAQLVSFPLGHAAAAWLPNVRIFGWSLNNGPFTIKVCTNF
jgi:OPT oligopeptide transporter protein